MAQPETYFYGQGKVYLAKRDATGKPKAWRWVGDVSALSLALTVENLTHRESYSGQRATVRRFPTSKDGSVTSTWHEYSPQNLSQVLYGEHAVIPAGTVTGESLGSNIAVGDRLTLAQQNVSDVEIGTLVAGTDYEVDPMYGAIEFLTAQTGPVTVTYAYEGGINTTLFSVQPENLALRYEGINLAEGGAAVIVELYKLAFDPVSALALINNDTSLAALETTAGVLFDTARPNDPLLGRFGRIINVAESA